MPRPAPRVKGQDRKNKLSPQRCVKNYFTFRLLCIRQMLAAAVAPESGGAARCVSPRVVAGRVRLEVGAGGSAGGVDHIMAALFAGIPLALVILLIV